MSALGMLVPFPYLSKNENCFSGWSILSKTRLFIYCLYTFSYFSVVHCIFYISWFGYWHRTFSTSTLYRLILPCQVSSLLSWSTGVLLLSAFIFILQIVFCSSAFLSISFISDYIVHCGLLISYSTCMFSLVFVAFPCYLDLVLSILLFPIFTLK